MPACPRCASPISHSQIRCPRCNLELKAHGHPGIDLHRAAGETPLCATCTYDADNSCNFPKRPNAFTCTLYQNVQTQPAAIRQEIYKIPLWRKQKFRLTLVVMIVFSLLVLSVSM